MNILMAASEANPFAKTGGLADVCYALSKALVSKGHKVSIVLPFYKKIKSKYENEFDFVTSYYVSMSYRSQYAGVFHKNFEGIDYYFIDNNQYFDRDNLYGYGDDIERFAYFQIALMELILKQGLNPDVIHVHDWQASMLPLLAKTRYAIAFDKIGSKFVLTIHNPAFQGMCDRSVLGDFFNLSQEYFDNGITRWNDCVSYLKTAIMLADKITTVSPTHCEEIKHGLHSYGLEYAICYRTFDFVGIVNGMDYGEFNPETDNYISSKYDIYSLDKKEINKSDFCKAFGIKNPELPLFGVVSRLTDQKGINLLLDVMPQYIGRANLFIVGSGDHYYEEAISVLSNECPNIYSYIGYNDEISHKAYAALDYFLMPSLYEPCGIGQMIAQKYGSLPIVRRTGGLADTVRADYDGFVFNNLDSMELIHEIDKALVIYTEKPALKEMQTLAMKRDHSWELSCEKYIELYKSIIK